MPNSQIQNVSTISELIETPFQGVTNALCLDRELEGDFEELVQKLHLKEDITEVSIADLEQLELTAAGAKARQHIIQDLNHLHQAGARPTLNLLKAYERDDTLDYIATDVYSFHVDRSPIPTHTYLCTYFGATSAVLANDQAIQKIQIPEIRTKLFQLHDGPQETFESFLTDFFFDLHYQPLSGATPTNMKLGQLWRLAVDHPQQKVLPCIHRAPIEHPGQLRLLLIC